MVTEGYVSYPSIINLTSIVSADDAADDGGTDFIMTSASSPVDKDDRRDINITSHLTSVTHALDEVKERVAVFRPSDDKTDGSSLGCAAFIADAVSRSVKCYSFA